MKHTTRERRSTTKATASALVALAVVGLGAPAVAAQGEQKPTMTTEVGMFVGGIDEKQAAKVGNIVRIEGSEKVLVDGKTGAELARIPADPKAAEAQALRQSKASAKSGAARATGTVYGNCGSSFVSIEDVGQRDIYRFRTGFKVNGSAFDFKWRLNIRAETGSSTYNFDWGDNGPMWPDNDWTSGWKNDDTPVNGWHVARVRTGLAILTNGKVCVAGYPSAGTYVT
jgi:hypothetical protein